MRAIFTKWPLEARATIFIGGIALVYGVLMGRLVWLHLGWVEAKASVAPYVKVLPPNRGGLYDRHGVKNPLGVDIPNKEMKCFVDAVEVEKRAKERYQRMVNQAKPKKRSLFSWTRAAQPSPDLVTFEAFHEEERWRFATALGQAIPYDAGAIFGLFARTNNTRHLVVHRVIDMDTVTKISAHPLLGGAVGFDRVSARDYPLKGELSPLLGYVKYEENTSKGMHGLERYFDHWLQGADGEIRGWMDAKQREIRERREFERWPRNGHDIILTIDQNLQHHVEMALEEGVLKNRAASGCAIVMAVQTGEILAMASWPRPDAQFDKRNLEAWRNRAIAFGYEPGSTMKLLTIGAALNEGVVTPETEIDCENGTWFFGGKRLRDTSRLGIVDVATIFTKSSNIGTAKIALELGATRLHGYLKRAGIGSPTGLGLAEEDIPSLAPYMKWYPIDITRVGIGYTVSVIPLQMAALYNAVANDGVRMRPMLWRHILTPEGEVVEGMSPPPIAAKDPLFRPETARTLRTLMEKVVTDGTGRAAQIPGYRVAGKTGTAQAYVAGKGYTDDLNVSFCGMIPADAPALTIVVVIERPQIDKAGGGSVAGPIFAEIGLNALRYLGIPPTPFATEYVAIPAYDLLLDAPYP
ncbi:MAG: penicillin-binding protein 2 [Kiritimatiellaeota bacterium]|nr:penicillin-binding protein 2 [Kiritimatiellota bacterium]